MSNAEKAAKLLSGAAREFVLATPRETYAVAKKIASRAGIDGGSYNFSRWARNRLDLFDNIVKQEIYRYKLTPFGLEVREAILCERDRIVAHSIAPEIVVAEKLEREAEAVDGSPYRAMMEAARFLRNLNKRLDEDPQARLMLSPVRPVPAAAKPVPKVWCDQCEMRVCASDAAGCKSRYCSVRDVAKELAA